MDRPVPLASWVAGAAVTVLSSATVAAVVLTSLPAPDAAPPAGRVAAAYVRAPAPVSLSFPAPVAPAPAAPAPAAPAPAAPAPPAAPPAGPAAAAPETPPGAVRPADPRCEGDGWQARRGAAAVAQLRRPADAGAVEVRFRSARPDVLGLAHLRERRVELFVRTCAQQTDGLVLHVLAHELGHLLDVIRMTDDLRAQWKAARGIPAETPWFGCDGCTDFATPAGDFAETYAQWQRGASSNRSELAPAPSRRELGQLAERFFRPLQGG